MSAVPIRDAASELGTSVSTVSRWIKRGAPVARRGRRGRGGQTLVDVPAMIAWRRSGLDLRGVAAGLPDVLAAAIERAWSETEGWQRQQLAGVFAATWYVVTCAVLDHLRAADPSIPEVSVVPEPIEFLRRIGRK